MKKILALILTAALSMTCVACGSKSAAPAGGDAPSEAAGQTVKNPNMDDGKNVLGIAWSNLAAEATQILMAHYEEVYKDYGFDEMILVQADNNVETQISQIQDLANQGVDMMIINSVDPDGIVPAVDAVMAKGIPVIAVDRKINTKLYYSLETDNVQCGRDVAKTIGAMTLDAADAGETVEILSVVSNTTSVAVRDRMNGFNEEIAYWNHCRVVAEPSCEASIEKAYNAIIDAFKTNPDIKVIFVTGDNYVAPAISALNELGKLYPYGDPNHIIIASIDGAPSALSVMLEGNNDIVANQRFDLFCTQTLGVCQEYLNGNLVEEGASNIKLLTPIVVPSNIKNMQAEGILWGLAAE